MGNAGTYDVFSTDAIFFRSMSSKNAFEEIRLVLTVNTEVCGGRRRGLGWDKPGLVNEHPRQRVATDRLERLRRQPLKRLWASLRAR